MIIRFFKLTTLTLLLQACAAAQPEIDIDHNVPSGEQSESGEDRGFDPCKLNSTLPVCS